MASVYNLADSFDAQRRSRTSQAETKLTVFAQNHLSNLHSRNATPGELASTAVQEIELHTKPCSMS